MLLKFKSNKLLRYLLNSLYLHKFNISILYTLFVIKKLACKMAVIATDKVKSALSFNCILGGNLWVLEERKLKSMK